jgi:hypothetical protein
MSETVNADRLAKVYVKIREKRKELAKQDRELEEQLELVAHQLLEICKEQGAATIRTQHGTISRRTNKRFWPTDWDAFYKFIKEKDVMSLLYQRINTANMQQYLEENPDVHPPGLNADVTQTIVIVKR